jgi:Zn-dependent protease
MTSQQLAERGIMFIVLLLSLSVHEWAHAFSARKLGDDTAERMDRLTLNPMAHIDPFGTILLPLMALFFTGSVFFAWAKPVPVNPARFKRGVSMSGGMALTAVAGPLSNLVLAVLSAIGIGLLYRFYPEAYDDRAHLLFACCAINVGLFVFNLLPVPPLDGSRVVDHFMPAKSRPQWESFQAFAPYVLMGLIVTGTAFLSGPIRAVNGMLIHLIQTIANA